MLVIPGQPGRDLCDRHLGVNRRQLLQVGGSAFLGMNLANVLKTERRNIPNTEQRSRTPEQCFGQVLERHTICHQV